MLSVTIILLKLEESWKGSTNRNFHGQFFIGNAIVLRQQFLCKHYGTPEYLRSVRLDELEICIGLNWRVWKSVYLAFLESKAVADCRYTRLIEPYLIGSRIDKFPQVLGHYVSHRSVSRVSTCTAWNRYMKDGEILRSVSKESQST